MDLSNFERRAGSGAPLVGATVRLYAAIAGDPSSQLQSTQTDANGQWSFTGLSVGEYDIKVESAGNNLVKWYKGIVKIGVSQIYASILEGPFYQGPGQSSVSAPATNVGRLYHKTDGRLYRQYGAGGEIKVDDVAQIVSASPSTSGPTTNSTSPADIPELSSGSVTFSGGRVIGMMSLQVSNDTAGAVTTFGFNQDGGGNLLNRDCHHVGANQAVIVTLFYDFGALSGSHTLKARWNVGNAAHTTTNSVLRRAFTIIEEKT